MNPPWVMVGVESFSIPMLVLGLLENKILGGIYTKCWEYRFPAGIWHRMYPTEGSGVSTGNLGFPASDFNYGTFVQNFACGGLNLFSIYQYIQQRFKHLHHY